MPAITATEARRGLFPLIQQVNDDHTPVEIVSKHGNAVLVSKEDWDSMEETAYLLRSPANAARLARATEQARRGEAGETSSTAREGRLRYRCLGRLHLLAGSRQEILKKINQLIDDITCDDPFSGIGKPEPLRHYLTGAWSRRITEEHRLAYLVQDDDLVVLQARYHNER